MGPGQCGKELGVYSKSNWNTLEYVKPLIGIMNLCLKEITHADVWNGMEGM